MSIPALLISLQENGALFSYMPISTRKTARRRLFLTACAERERTNKDSAVNLLCGEGYIRAALDRWVLGERVYSAFLKKLIPPPDEIWEIRVTAPRPQARLFGRFAEPDTLILTGFFTRDHLGKNGSAAWREAMKDCVRQWEALLSGHAPYSAASIHDYVTENCDDFNVNASGKR